jgi:predicted DNA-binding protein with PD1-like motif
MRTKLISSRPKTFAVVFETGDEVMEGLKAFASEQQLSAAQFAAIGAFSRAVVGFFDVSTREYKRIPVSEQVEVLSLVGDITLANGDEPQLHAHAVLGDSDGTTRGGHLLEGHVRPTLEVILTESPKHLHRVRDPATGLLLIHLPAEREPSRKPRVKLTRLGRRRRHSRNAALESSRSSASERE